MEDPTTPADLDAVRADVADETVHSSEGVELFVAERGLDDEDTARRLAASFWGAVLAVEREHREVGGFGHDEFIEMRARKGDVFTGARLAGVDFDTASAIADDVHINTDRTKWGPTGGVDGVAAAIELVRAYGTPEEFFGMPVVEFIGEL